MLLVTLGPHGKSIFMHFQEHFFCPQYVVGAPPTSNVGVHFGGRGQITQALKQVCPQSFEGGISQNAELIAYFMPDLSCLALSRSMLFCVVWYWRVLSCIGLAWLDLSCPVCPVLIHIASFLAFLDLLRTWCCSL